MVLAPLAALLVTAAPACGLPAARPGAVPWRPGEQLGFDIDVMGVVKAGVLSLTVEKPQFGGTVVPIRARVENTSVFAKVREVKGLAMTWVDARTLRPEHYREEAMEDGVHKVTDALIKQNAGKPFLPVSWEWKDRKGVDTYPRQGEVLDLVSAFYYLRALELKPGERLCFDLVGNRRLWHLEGEVAAGTEKVETAAGTFDTVRLDGVGVRADDPSSKRPIHIWISTDSRRLLVAAVSEIDLGPVRAMLSRVGGGTSNAD